MKTALWDKTKLFETLKDTERANGRASGPVLTFQLLTGLSHRRDQIASRIVNVVVVVVVAVVAIFAMSISI